MNIPSRTWFRLLAGILACVFFSFGVVKLLGWLYWLSGRGVITLVLPPVGSLAALGVISVGCSIVLWFALLKVGWHKSLISRLSILVVAFAFGLGSAVLSRSACYKYLDGFAARVSANIRETDAIIWADQTFADTAVPQSGYGLASLSPGKIPSFFAPVFPEGTPSAVVYYSADGKPICVHVFIGGGLMVSGVAIFNTNATPASENRLDYRPCGNRMYAFQMY